MSSFRPKVKGKTREEKREYLNALPYVYQLRHTGESFCLMIPELSLVAIHPQLDAAYADLTRQREALFQRCLDIGAEEDIVFPRQFTQGRETWRQVTMFTYKALIICGLTGLAILIGGSMVVNKMSIALSGVFDKTTEKVMSLAENFSNAPEARKEEHLEKLRTFLKSMKPIIHEVRQTLEEERTGEIKTKR